LLQQSGGDQLVEYKGSNPRSEGKVRESGEGSPR